MKETSKGSNFIPLERNTSTRKVEGYPHSVQRNLKQHLFILRGHVVCKSSVKMYTFYKEKPNFCGRLVKEF